jgi:hypothetical protein
MASGQVAPRQVGQLARHVCTALIAGAIGGYLAALLRPRGAEAYASTYAAPSPDTMAPPAAAGGGPLPEPVSAADEITLPRDPAAAVETAPGRHRGAGGWQAGNSSAPPNGRAR